MAYDSELADRLRALLAGEAGLTEKKMFGGHAFLLDGHMAVAASSRSAMMLRVDPEEYEALVQQDGASPFEMRGREMRGWLHVDLGPTASDDEIANWADHGVRYVRTLPPK